jgi:4-hydroxy-tetrahydrodipicolinate reductase
MIIGNGRLGAAIATTLGDTGGPLPRVLGRPLAGSHAAASFAGVDVVFDASRGDAVRRNVEDCLAGGARLFVIATTGWDDDRSRVDRALIVADAAAVAAPNFSVGAALFLRLIDASARLFGAVESFDPYILEWHRRAKRDRPSGTALEISRRLAAARPSDVDITAIRAGSSPGMHLVGFDAPGETVELRLTARDRSAYASGALAAAAWLTRQPRPPGIHSFDHVVDELLGIEAPPANRPPTPSPPIAPAATQELAHAG